MVKWKVFTIDSRERMARGIWESLEQTEYGQQREGEEMGERLGGGREGVKRGQKRETKRAHSQNSRVIRRNEQLGGGGGKPMNWSLGKGRARMPACALKCVRDPL